MTDTLGPYELRGELGRGAMAIVWRGYDPQLNREVAIKEPVIAHGTPHEVAEELGARFVREGRAAASLNHPGIVTIHATDVYGGRPAIVMELIEGVTLRHLIDARGALTPSVARSITEQILDAIGYAHERGIVHRDLKPDNIFVTDDGRVKITDFGIAHMGGGTALTQQGTVMGTPGYMAPEQIKGEPVDARADLFAVGVILHEMLVGRNPFLADDPHPTTVMYRVLNESLPELPRAARTVYGDVIGRATSKNPDERPVSAVEMMRLLRGERVNSTSSRGRVAVERSGPRKRKGWLLAGAGAAAIAVVAAALWLWIPRSDGQVQYGLGVVQRYGAQDERAIRTRIEDFLIAGVIPQGMGWGIAVPRMESHVTRDFRFGMASDDLYLRSADRPGDTGKTLVLRPPAGVSFAEAAERIRGGLDPVRVIAIRPGAADVQFRGSWSGLASYAGTATLVWVNDEWLIDDSNFTYLQ